MADRFDVAARLAEGRAAAEHTQSYVWACSVLGYQHPDLTAHCSQVRDWYGSENGLDLHALDRDSVELCAAVTAIEEALRIQRAQIGELAANWAGSGAAATVEFLQRHCEAGNAVATGVRAAAEGCAALRDNLWQLIDAKVATAVAIDDRTVPQRPAWLAAAEAVTTGAGDRPSADEMVHQQVKPYVDNDIRTDWLTAMRSTLASAAASYDALTDRLTTAPAANFQLPGDLGSSCSVPSDEPVQPIAPAVSVPIAPAAAVSPSDGAAAAWSPAVSPPAGGMAPIPGDLFSAVPLDPVPSMSPTPPTVPMSGFEDLPAAPPISDAGTPFGDATGMPGGSGDLGNLGGVGGLSSLGSLVGRIADAIGGLVGSLAEGLADPSGIDDSPFDDPPGADDLLDDEDADDRLDDNGNDRPDDEDDDEEADDEQANDEQADCGGEDVASGSAADSSPEDVGEGPTAQEVTTPPADGPPSATPPIGEPSQPGAAPLPGEPPPAPPDPQSDGSTPCEIAADELPQAGQ